MLEKDEVEEYKTQKSTEEEQRASHTRPNEAVRVATLLI